MTLKYMEGFETSRSETDVRARGYMYTASGYSAALVPSVSGLTGYALTGIAAAISNTTNAQFNGANSTFGIWTGTTVNQAWTAGGFSYGFSATANCSAITGQYYGYAMAPTSTVMLTTACYDAQNALYWSIGSSGSTYNLFTSPDLMTWTPVATLPTTVSASSSIQYVGGGQIVFVSGAGFSSVPVTIYITTNNGSSWTSVSPTAAVSAGSTTGQVIATGNSAFPYLLSVNLNNSGSNTLAYGAWVGKLDGTQMTRTVNYNTTIASGLPNTIGAPVIMGNIVVTTFVNRSNSNNVLYSANVQSATLSTDTWGQTLITNAGNIGPIAYNPTSNLYVMGSNTGIWTIPNTGAVGTPALLTTGTVSATQRWSTTQVNAIFWTGSQMVAMTQLGHVLTSPDGITWTEVGPKVLPLAVTGYHYQTAYYDGSRYVVHTDTTTGLVCTTTDGVNNWVTRYASHKTPIAVNSTSPNLCGLWFTGTTTQPANPVGSALAAPGSGETMFGFNIAPVTAAGALIAYGTRISTSPSSGTLVFTNNFTGTVATPAQATHYYELVFTSVTGTTNMFNVTMYIDGALMYTQNSVQPIATSDTTTQIILTPLPANQEVAQIDDVYFNLIDGKGVSGPQGTVNIGVQRPTTDVSAVWTKTGSAASNSLSVNQSALSSASANYVSSTTAGDKDVYSSTTTVPAGYTAKAIQHEAYFSKLSNTNPTVNLGVSSGGTESDSPNVVVATSSATYVNQTWDTNPNGNVAWSNTTINAAQFVLNHVV